MQSIYIILIHIICEPAAVITLTESLWLKCSEFCITAGVQRFGAGASGDRRLSRLLVPYINALFEYELTSSRQILKMKQDVTLEQKESVDIVLMSVRCEICIYVSIT